MLFYDGVEVAFLPKREMMKRDVRPEIRLLVPSRDSVTCLF